MKRYYFVFFLMIYFCSCQDASEDGFGYLQLSSVECVCVVCVCVCVCVCVSDSLLGTVFGRTCYVSYGEGGRGIQGH